MSADQFPECQLYQIRIVTAFPEKCPLASGNPMDALIRIRDAAWGQLGSTNSSNYVRGLANREKQRVCGECVSQLMRHQWVKHLRANLPPDSLRPSVPVSATNTRRRVPVVERRPSSAI